jgi:hypothetical protein
VLLLRLVELSEGARRSRRFTVRPSTDQPCVNTATIRVEAG